MCFRKLPKPLRARINDYYQARYGGKWFDEKEILSLLSKSLKEVPEELFPFIINSIQFNCIYIAPEQ